jgi:intein/homing endonuclease
MAIKKEYALDIFAHKQRTVPWESLSRAVKKGNRRRLFKKYDLTVEDNHNFFANGILVHNCLWGGNAGYAWARKVVRQMDAADKKAKKSRASLVPLFAELVKIAGVGYEALDGIRVSELAAVANQLDAEGFHKEADDLDELLLSLAMKDDDTAEGEPVEDAQTAEEAPIEYSERDYSEEDMHDSNAYWHWQNMKEYEPEKATHNRLISEFVELFKGLGKTDIATIENHGDTAIIGSGPNAVEVSITLDKDGEELYRFIRHADGLESSVRAYFIFHQFDYDDIINTAIHLYVSPFKK